MRIMTQYASRHIQTSLLARELQEQQITLLGWKNSAQSSATLLAQSLEEQGIRCSWVWYPDHGERNGSETGTAFFCLDREIRRVDHFSFDKGTDGGKPYVHTALGVQIEGAEDWFYLLSVEPVKDFQNPWKLLNGCIAAKRLCSTVWLLGMDSSRKEIPAGNWTEAADGEIWCSRTREIRWYPYQNPEKLHPQRKGAAIIEVEE